MQYECVKEQRINEQMWENNNQMLKIVRLIVKFSRLTKISNSLKHCIFLDLENFLIYLDLEIFMHYRT